MKTITLAVLAMALALPAAAEPPPWAKAHGWRKKNDPSYVGYTGKRWTKDYGVVEGHCNTDQVGAVIGAKIGRAIDDSDRACMGHALELAGEHKTVTWKSAKGVQYELTPTKNIGDRANPCREFVTRVSSARVADAVKGVACRRGNGEWVFKS